MKMISEKNYRQKMDEEVAPFLHQNRYSGIFRPKGDSGLYYERYGGQAEQVVVIVHGFSESAEKYVEMIYYFLQAGYRVYIFDVRGHGRSARAVEDLSMVHVDHYEQYLWDLAYFTEKIVKAENLNARLYLYAHSMGGGIGAAFLEQYPEVFSKAVLSSPMIRPQTGEVPFGAARLIAQAQVRAGKGKQYVMGQQGFRADETFEDSAATSRARYDYYYQKKCSERLFQTSGASYGWLCEAARMAGYVLRKRNCRNIHTDILLFRAEKDDFVDGKAQERFVKQVKTARLVEAPGAKHEIYMSSDDILQAYVGQIFAFFQRSLPTSKKLLSGQRLRFSLAPS